MKPINYEMAHECLGNAESFTPDKQELAIIEAMAAQTFATLALVDEIRDMRSFVAEYLAAAEDLMATGVKDVVAEEVSSALIDWTQFPKNMLTTTGGVS